MSIVASVFLWIIPLLAVAALAAGLVAFNERRKREEFQRRQAQAAQRRSQEKELEKMKIDDL